MLANEQAGRRPALVVSANEFNAWPVELAIVVPLTTATRPFPHHVPVAGSGLDRPSFARPEDVRSISAVRLIRRLGAAESGTVDEVARWLREFMLL